MYIRDMGKIYEEKLILLNNFVPDFTGLHGKDPDPVKKSGFGSCQKGPDPNGHGSWKCAVTACFLVEMQLLVSHSVDDLTLV
jgi:hypothetical protein